MMYSQPGGQPAPGYPPYGMPPTGPRAPQPPTSRMGGLSLGPPMGNLQQAYQPTPPTSGMRGPPPPGSIGTAPPQPGSSLVGYGQYPPSGIQPGPPPPSMGGPPSSMGGSFQSPPGTGPSIQPHPPPPGGPGGPPGQPSPPMFMQPPTPGGPPSNITGPPPPPAPSSNPSTSNFPPPSSQPMGSQFPGGPSPPSAGHGMAPPPGPPLMGHHAPPAMMTGPPPPTSRQQPGMPPPPGHSSGGHQSISGAPPMGGMGGGPPPPTSMMPPPGPGGQPPSSFPPPGGSRMYTGPPGGGGGPQYPPPPGGPGGGTMGPGSQGYPRSTGPPPSPGMTGPIQQQPRSRIDPDQMPNPVAVIKSDQELRGSTPYLTSTRGLPPPLVTTNFTAQDDGNSNPRYVRSTLYTVPCSKDLLNGCKIPLGLVVQPLADIPRNEDTLHLVDHGASGPIRCNRCKAYMNPFARFIDGGRQYLCPICQCSNAVPPEYFSHLDHQGRRTDANMRPELCYGTVEYVATKDYCKEGRLPKPPAYIFMLDVSQANQQNGLLNLFTSTILSILDSLPGANEEGGSPIQVGFVTYDKVLHFYNVRASLAQPQMMVLTDVSEVFVPLVEGFLVNADEAKPMLESLMSQLPGMFAGSRSPQVILEPVMRAGMEALKASGRNGRLFVFHSSLPTAHAPGSLKNRVDTKLLGTDKEKSMFSPASTPYQKLAEECVKYGVGVELFLFPTNYCDVATLGDFVSTTGGELHYYRGYQASRDGERFIEDLRCCISRSTGFDAVMRVRASTGLRPTGFFGAFFMANTTDIELGNVDCDKAIAVEIKHDDKLREDDIAFFQAALLYTNLKGERRLRVHNMALNCSTKYQDIYRSCEIDTLINYFSKSIIKASLSMSYKSIRDSFTHQIAVILSCYRKHCSSQSPPGQLILPESLKLLPMYSNCLLKSDALLSPQTVMLLDEKCWFMYSVLSMSTCEVQHFLYPRVYSLHDVNTDEKGLPPLLRCTGQKMLETGVYVVVNGFVMVVWIGQQVSGDMVAKLFGVTSQAQINMDMHSLPALDNPLSFRVRGIISQLQAGSQHCMKLILTKQRDKTEVLYRRLLKEDKGTGQWEGTSYIDFLCQVHRDIKEILS